MALTRALKTILSRRTGQSVNPAIGRDSSGIALFMVLASVSVLAILVTEFTYIAQISQSIAYGGLDQAKAHYLAKSGLKLSLLRLKAYQQVKALVANLGPAAGAVGVPRGVIEKIWSFPFFYPVPTNIPGIGASEKAAIEKFQKDSGLDGKFSALIESESSRFNLNTLLANFNPTPTGTPSPSSSGTPVPAGTPTPNAAPNPTQTFNPDEARAGLNTYLSTIITQKSEADPDFGTNYRDFRVDELVDVIAGWIDRTYQRRTPNNLDKVPMKKAPFYSLPELHMLPYLDDELYQLFAPNLTVGMSTGLNINTMKEPTLRALVPGMTKDEVTEFFKFRDSEEVDNQFKDADKFFEYLGKNVAVYKGNQEAVNQLKNDLAKKNVKLITDETQFKITVRAEVNSAARTIEAWVTLGTATPSSTSSTGNPAGGNPPPLSGPGPTGANPTATPAKDSGLKITFMKIL